MSVPTDTQLRAFDRFERTFDADRFGDDLAFIERHAAVLVEGNFANAAAFLRDRPSHRFLRPMVTTDDQDTLDVIRGRVADAIVHAHRATRPPPVVAERLHVAAGATEHGYVPLGTRASRRMVRCKCCPAVTALVFAFAFAVTSAWLLALGASLSLAGWVVFGAALACGCGGIGAVAWAVWWEDDIEIEWDRA